MLVPEAWEQHRDLDPELRGFYRFHSALMEPWDGPAGLIFTDGVGVGARLDRNGLRPLRYAVCDDGLVVCCIRGGRRRPHRPRRGRAGPARARPDALRRSHPRRSSTTTRARSAWPPPRPTPSGPPTGFYDLAPGEPVERAARRPRGAPGRARLHQGGAGHGAQAHGRRRLRAHLLDGRRRPAPPWRLGPARSTTTSSSASPRSPTRPSTPSASAG